MDSYFTVFLAIIVLASISGFFTFNMFRKADRKIWEAFVPFYNQYIILKYIIDRPVWWIALNLIPIVGPIISIVIIYDLLASFKHKGYLHAFLAVITCGLYLIYVNLKKDLTYTGVEKREENLISSLIFAVVLATSVHTFMIQPYTIPTSSMEKTLMVGDFLFVSKMTYGTRIPFTPLAVPFIHSVLSGNPSRPETVTKSYVDKLRLPYFRLPKFKSVERNDIVVFNYPADSVHTAVDRKDNYIKRCVAIAGDELKIEEGTLYINGKPSVLPKDNQLQYSYAIASKRQINFDRFLKMGIKDVQGGNGMNLKEFLDTEQYTFIAHLTEKEVTLIQQKFPSITKVKKIVLPKGAINAKPFPTNSSWNQDFYGPLTVPKQGDVIHLNKENYDTYKALIRTYENHTLEQKGDDFYIDGTKNNQYTVEQDYYFMMGDNRHASLDSRYWGFVPEDHIVGTPFFVWMSIDWDRSNPMAFSKWKFRTDRIMTLVNQDTNEKKSYKWYALALLIAYFGYSSFVGSKKNKED